MTRRRYTEICVLHKCLQIRYICTKQIKESHKKRLKMLIGQEKPNKFEASLVNKRYEKYSISLNKKYPGCIIPPIPEKTREERLGHARQQRSYHAAVEGRAKVAMPKVFRGFRESPDAPAVGLVEAGL